MIRLYEILVPTVRNNGRPIRLRFHKIWDQKVREIAGGMTILSPARGQWVSETGELFVERMIPVRIACTKEQIEQIADFTRTYYDQKVILFYLVSNEVHFFTGKKNEFSPVL